MKKVFTFLITILLSFTLFSCIIEGDEIPKENIDLPDRYASINKKSDETIYISADPSGNINSIKTTKHLRNTTFNYYETYGSFESNGNLNISYGNANIIIEGDKALAPSLENTNNFFFMLNLNKDDYINKLPFQISVNYYLNDVKVTYEKLKGANGEIGIEIIITPNLLADDYFKNFGAQVQIPIDLTKAQIIEHKGSMAEIQTGQKATLAYMVLPNTEQTIYLKLLGSNFSFDGMDISYQILDYFDILTSFIDLDSLDIANLIDFGIITTLTQILNAIDYELAPLFAGLSNFQYLTDEQLMTQFSGLVEKLNSNDFNMGLNISPSMLKHDLENKAQLEIEFNTLNSTVLSLISMITSTFTDLTYELSSAPELISLIVNVLPYPDYYMNFTNIVNNFNDIEMILSNFDDVDINDLLTPGNQILSALNQASKKGIEVEVYFNSLIKEMYTLPLDLKPFVDNLDLFIEPLTNLFIVFELLKNLHTTLDAYATLITNLKLMDAFVSNQYVDMFLYGLTSIDPNNIGLLPGLEVFTTFEFNPEDLNSLLALKQLFQSETNIRPIDEIILGFIEINYNLAINPDAQTLSFYGIMDKLNLITTLVEQIPVVNKDDAKSFLHKKNSPPEQTSFILRISGF